MPSSPRFYQRAKLTSKTLQSFNGTRNRPKKKKEKDLEKAKAALQEQLKPPSPTESVSDLEEADDVRDARRRIRELKKMIISKCADVERMRTEIAKAPDKLFEEQKTLRGETIATNEKIHTLRKKIEELTLRKIQQDRSLIESAVKLTFLQSMTDVVTGKVTKRDAEEVGPATDEDLEDLVHFHQGMERRAADQVVKYNELIQKLENVTKTCREEMPEAWQEYLKKKEDYDYIMRRYTRLMHQQTDRDRVLTESIKCTNIQISNQNNDFINRWTALENDWKDIEENFIEQQNNVLEILNKLYKTAGDDRRKKKYHEDLTMCEDLIAQYDRGDWVMPVQEKIITHRGRKIKVPTVVSMTKILPSVARTVSWRSKRTVETSSIGDQSEMNENDGSIQLEREPAV